MTEKDLQERYRVLKEIAVEYASEIDGEWGNGTATLEELAQELENEIDERLVHEEKLRNV